MAGLKDNDTESRIKHATGQGFAHRPPRKHVFGDAEEVATRVGGTFPSLPDSRPTTFRQLGPAGSGGNLNNEKPRRYSGNQKFGNPRGYA
jgi:hypothetical protein